MPERLLPPGNRALVRKLASLDALDPPAKAIAKQVRKIIKPGPVKEALSGSWLGHALHPMLTDVTIGTFTSAVMLDWLGGKSARPAARRLIGIGLLSTPPTVASGYSDWADSEVGDDSVRRIGMVHAAANATGATLFAASWARRRNGGGRLLALAGSGVLTASGYLGGHLSFAEGIGVDQTAFEHPPEGWTPVLGSGDLQEGDKRCVMAEGTAVMVARSGGELYALSDHCSHRGGPLHEGELSDGTITCPWHSSVFDLRDGALVHGPAAYPQPAWDVRVRDDRIEVRRR
jgi:nitrite reductase/ring-hydroxylating ferredoxin subunit/uncharacterized membrane protein